MSTIMADYFPVISRAISGLENNTPETRNSVYDRARAAIVRQLRAIEPPLPEEDIAREQAQLEEAIRKVEANAPGAATSPSPTSRPVTPPPVARRSPEAPVRPASEPARPPAPETVKPEMAQAPRPPAASGVRPAKRADGRPIIRTAEEKPAPERGRRSNAVIGIAVVAVIALGVTALVARDQIAALFGGGEQVATVETPTPEAPTERPAEASPPQQEAKTDDRLPQEQPSGAPASEQQQPAEAQPSGQQQATPETPAPETPAPAEPAPAATPAPGPVAEAPAVQPQPEQPSQPGPLVAQRATLYEEGANQQSGEAVGGTVVWRNDSVSGGQGQPLESSIRGDIDIPGRKLRASIVIRRNADATLPASHTIEIQFNLPPDFPNAGISNVPGVLMKADESARGAAVAGLSVRVTNGFFLIGLSNAESERTVNEQLLRDRGWVDIPVLYDNGRRAVLTLEKGTPGSQAFAEAFNSWRGGASAAGQR